MSSASTIIAYEGGRVPVPAGKDAANLRLGLLKIGVGNRPAFVARGSSVFAAGFVGAVAVGPYRVEVLPKTVGGESAPQARAILFNMLRWAGGDARVAWLPGAADSVQDDLIDIVQRRAASELLERLEVGAPRRYHPVEESSSVLRGAIQFGRLARQNPAQAHRLPIRHSPLTADNDLGKLLRALATRLRDQAESWSVRRDVDRALELLPGVQSQELTPELVGRVRLGRFESDWSGLVELASLLAATRAPDPTGFGGTAQPTLMFPLNRLFELAVRRALSRALQPPISCPLSPGSHRLISAVATGQEALSIRPDLLFRRRGAPIAVGDAKWKILSPEATRRGVSPADTYQILTYMRHFRVKHGMLFFPRASWMPADWSEAFEVASPEAERITLVAVDVAAMVSRGREARESAAADLASRVTAVLEPAPLPDA